MRFNPGDSERNRALIGSLSDSGLEFAAAEFRAAAYNADHRSDVGLADWLNGLAEDVDAEYQQRGLGEGPIGTVGWSSNRL